MYRQCTLSLAKRTMMVRAKDEIAGTGQGIVIH